MNKTELNTEQKIAFFSISSLLSNKKRRDQERLLWRAYCTSGGDPSAIPGFYDFGVEDGLIWCPTLKEFQEAIMNKSRNPVERME